MKTLSHFLDSNWDKKSPLLLGCSGGPDSKALLYLLRNSGVKALHIAHVDHGWREESSKEAFELKKEVEGLGFPFHLLKIQPAEKNKEEAARGERLQFFRSLFEKTPFQALFLAHQADDLAETSLKRVLEGAHLPFLFGMKPVSSFEGMAIWRPLLGLKKERLLEFLRKDKISFFTDPSNRDVTFLRSRMREEIFPVINKKFGKETTFNLALLTERSSELKEYLERKISPIPIMQGPWGLKVILRGIERIEARFLIQKICEKTPLSRNLIETLLDWIEEGGGEKNLRKDIYSYKGSAFFLHNTLPEIPEVNSTDLGETQLKGWDLIISQCNGERLIPNWEEVWSGIFSATVPIDTYSLKRVVPGFGKKFKKLWNEKKIPPFFRNLVPGLFKNGEMVSDFISGKTFFEGAHQLRLDFYYNPTSSKSTK